MSTALYDIDAVRRIETRAGAGAALMERAGQAAWRVVLDRWPQARRIAVVCGPGNNGGDGDVVARHAHASGRDVVVIRHAAHAPHTDAARQAHALLRQAGVPTSHDLAALDHRDVIIDAVLGIGLSRAPDAPISAVLHAINAAQAPVLALDVPSGVDAGTGFAYPAAVRADHTVEFIACKLGLRTGAARGHVGMMTLACLLDADPSDIAAPVAIALNATDLSRMLAPRAIDSHKGLHGRVLCVGGDTGHGGAILLAAEAALRTGAGLVDIETRLRHVAAALTRMPEAMARATRDAAGLAALIRQADTCVVGPGLGQGAWGASRLAACIGSARRLVLDADALNLVAARAGALPAATILTPHPGEAARLLGCSVSDVQRDRARAARALAERYGAVVVLKGAGTVIAAEGEVSRVIDAGNPGMAVGGMGDVLAGVIASLCAQGLDAFSGACAGALLHAAAGDLAAREGERGLLPTDLMPHFRRLANPVAR